MSIDLSIKEKNDFKYYTGSHPDIKKHYRSGNRPTEFGNKVWATSHVLLDYLESQPFDLNELRVLEIGCGWGLLGVYLSKKFNCQVTCSDLDECVLPIVEMHANLNEVSVQTKQASFAQLDVGYLQNFDLIIGAEVCYSNEVAQELNDLVKRSSRAKVKYVLIGDPGRPDFTDCSDYCLEHHNAQVIELPGTVNGKKTHLLSIQMS